jgi:hypothetical protein
MQVHKSPRRDAESSGKQNIALAKLVIVAATIQHLRMAERQGEITTTVATYHQ